MHNVVKVGDLRKHNKIVTEKDIAAFDIGTVHKVCSTFALAREIEWTSRLFVLDMIEGDEEGIGTKLTIDHISPALVGDELTIEAEVKELEGNSLICSYIARVSDRIVAEGITGQKVLKRKRIKEIFSTFA